jgi:DNA polymerase-4
VRGWTVTPKVRYADFRQITHSRPFAKLIQSRSIIEGVSVELLSVLFPLGNGVRLLRVTLSSLSTEAQAGAPS